MDRALPFCAGDLGLIPAVGKAKKARNQHYSDVSDPSHYNKEAGEIGGKTCDLWKIDVTRCPTTRAGSK